MPAPVKIIRANHMGMCFGVRDAIALARAEAQNKPLSVLGDLVHNESVLTDLQQHGVRIVQQIPDLETSTVMITAHGASDKAIRRVQERGHNVIEATCPLVKFAHRSVGKLVAEGYHPVIIGKRDHIEVRGMTEDLESFDVILSDTDVEKLAEHPRFGFACQTTQPLDRVRHLINLVQQRFPSAEYRFIDTVCRPTKQRQMAAIDLAHRSDVVIVIGGAHSNNTRELVSTCHQFCPRVYHVQTAEDLRMEWFLGAATIGITAGTSTPDATIDAVENWLQARFVSSEQLRAEQDRLHLAKLR